MQTYDLVVIGAGPAGYVAAIRASQLKMKAALVEKNTTLGGTCLNVGCVPSKVMLESSEKYALLSGGLDTHGISLSNPQIDLTVLQQRRQRIVDEVVGGLAMLMKKNGIDVIRGHASVTAPGSVSVVTGDETLELHTGAIVLATGSTAVELPFMPFDHQTVIDSTDALHLADIPERLAVIGGGAVGLELGSVWKRLGSEVTVIEMLPQAVPTEDPDVAEVLTKALRKAGVKLLTGAKVVGVQDVDGRKRVEYEQDGQTDAIEADAILMAVGRRAVLDIGLDAAGVQTEKPGIKVDERLQTTADGVYAAGDCIRGIGLAHLASHEAIAAVENALGEQGHVNYDCVPACIFTHPEIASVGLKEKQAREQGREVTVGKFPFSANSRAGAVRAREGFVKLIADASSGQLIGACIVGPSAAELIHAPAVAIELGATIDEVADTIFAHPTFSEAIHEAALNALGRTIHLPPSK